jgi:hypothetical protein
MAVLLSCICRADRCGIPCDTVRFLRDNDRWFAGGFLLTLFSSFGGAGR